MARKIIIDADPGIGDSLAIVTALHDPSLDVLALTATAGCVSALQATRNLQTIVEHVDPKKWPRLGAATESSTAPPAEIDAVIKQFSRLHGRSGLGDDKLDFADLHHPHESAKLLTDLVRTNPNEITLITLGPLTNVAVACERFPDFLSLLGNLVCLGGAVTTGGDANAAAEFNIFLDPPSARDVLRSPATKTIVPLDVSNQVVMTFGEFNRLGLTAVEGPDGFLHRLLTHFFRAHHEHLGLEGVPLRELAALAVVACPKYFDSQGMVVDVETRGELTRGMTVFDRRASEQWQSNIDVVREVDVRGVLDYLFSIVGSR